MKKWGFILLLLLFVELVLFFFSGALTGNSILNDFGKFSLQESFPIIILFFTLAMFLFNLKGEYKLSSQKEIYNKDGQNKNNNLQRKLERSEQVCRKYNSHLEDVQKKVNFEKEMYFLGNSLTGRVLDFAKSKLGMKSNLREIRAQENLVINTLKSGYEKIERQEKLSNSFVSNAIKSVYEENDFINSYLKNSPEFNTKLESALNSNSSSEKKEFLKKYLETYNKINQELGYLNKSVPNEDFEKVIVMMKKDDKIKMPLNYLRQINSHTGTDFEIENLIAVHKTNYLPHGKIQTTGSAKKGKSPRQTIHFSLNSAVAPHMERADPLTGEQIENEKYAVLVPVKDIKDRVINLMPTDTFLFGDYPLPKDAELIISYEKAKHLTDKRLEAIKKNSGAEIVSIGNEGESIGKTIKRRIEERGYTFRPQGMHYWTKGFLDSDEDGMKRVSDLAKVLGKTNDLHYGSAFSKAEKFSNLYSGFSREGKLDSIHSNPLNFYRTRKEKLKDVGKELKKVRGKNLTQEEKDAYKKLTENFPK
jgi:hypothetical protein